MRAELRDLCALEDAQKRSLLGTCGTRESKHFEGDRRHVHFLSINR